jgi:YfiH family protein
VLGIALGAAQVRWTSRIDGHLGLLRPGDDRDALEARRRAVAAQPWSWLHQVHGATVVTVRGAGDPTGQDADALVTAAAGVVLAVFTADCAPVALSSPEGVVGIAHAGWRGLAGGVVERAVDAMRSLGATSVSAALGPCIRAGCYEFGARDLDRVAAVLGDGVRASTTWGTPALDLAAAVTASLSRAGAVLTADAGACTACSDTWFSHRARAETDRQATLVWRDQ